jgi:hypothetical protein
MGITLVREQITISRVGTVPQTDLFQVVPPLQLPSHSHQRPSAVAYTLRPLSVLAAACMGTLRGAYPENMIFRTHGHGSGNAVEVDTDGFSSM